RVRNELHYHVNRPADVLVKSLQPTVAHHLGYADRSPVRRLEAFMGDLYSHMRNIYLITRTLEQRLALLPHPERRLPSFGKYLREFGRLTCLVQHEFYHQYTADEHTLVCLEQLDRIWEAEKPPYSNYSEIFRDIERPFVLYLALLLHDAGKAARAGKHSAIGGHLALNAARRLGLDGATTHTLRLIIEHHLTMSRISQRRDLDDPSVIRNFAAQIQNA